MTTKQTHFVVYRLHWIAQQDWESKGKQRYWLRLPGAVRIQSFTDPDEAWDFQKEEELKARKVVNPFCCGGNALFYQTHLDEERLHDWLLDHNIEPPNLQVDVKKRWQKWYKEQVNTWNDQEFATVWEALDKVRFYQLKEEPMRATVYMIQEIGWIYNDEGYDVSPEGGKTVKAFRNREKAEAELQRMESDRRGDRKEFWGYDYGQRLDHQTPFGPFSNEEVYLDGSTPIFYELVEVPLDELITQESGQ